MQRNTCIMCMPNLYPKIKTNGTVKRILQPWSGAAWTALLLPLLLPPFFHFPSFYQNKDTIIICGPDFLKSDFSLEPISLPPPQQFLNNHTRANTMGSGILAHKSGNCRKNVLYILTRCCISLSTSRLLHTQVLLSKKNSCGNDRNFPEC